MNAAEDRLTELMEAATRALQPPLEAILAEGERRGRSRRRRRRAAVAAGTAAVVLLAGTGAAAGLRLTRGTGYDAAGAPAAVHRPSGAPSSTDRASPSPSETALGAATPEPTRSATEPLVPINATAAYNILKMSVPAGWTFGAYKPSDAINSLLDIDVDDGTGHARIFVGIGLNAKSGMDPIDCGQQKQAQVLNAGGAQPSGAPSISCTIQRYTDGDLVMQQVLPVGMYGEYMYRIIANRADGVALEITATNGDFGGVAGAVTEAQPPLSIAQWTAIAMERIWQLRVPVSLAK